MSNVGSSFSHEGKPGETTEWEDILRAKGIIAPKEVDKEAAMRAVLEEAHDAAEAARKADPLAGKSLEELREVEDEPEYADGHMLDEYRRKRVAELKAAAARNKFGTMGHLSRDDFVREVSEGSKEVWVVLLLYKDGIPNSKVLEELMPRVAAKHRSTKFLKIVSDQCIAAYPDKNVPTLILYHGGEMRSQIVGIADFGGVHANVDCIEWVLSKAGAVETDLEADPRSLLKAGGAGGGGYSAFRVGGAGGGARRGRRGDDDDDDD